MHDIIGKKVQIVLIWWVIAVVLPVSGCNNDSGSLEPVEVKDYEGKNEFDDNGFRENSISGVQTIDLKSYELSVTGLVKNDLKFNYQQVIDEYPHYQKTVTLNCVEGWDATVLWEGVLVKDLITRAESLPSAVTVIFHAGDGYTTSFPLDYIIDNDIIIAYMMNGKTLPPERGFPFALVAESKWGYKWIRWITTIELSNDSNYRGYWEIKGYSNSGDFDKSFLEK